MKDFHNVFAYYDKSKPKKIKCQRNYIFISYDMMLKYIAQKESTLQHIQKCKYIQKIVEMI